MASSFPTSTDVIASAGSTLASPAHSTLHNSLRDGLAAVQTYVKSQIAAITANSWVTTARIANSAVTDDKIVSLSTSKLNGTITSPVVATRVSASEYMRAGTGTGNPSFVVQRYGGVLSGAGVGQVLHAIDLGHRRIIQAEMWWQGAGEEMRPCDITAIDGSLIYFNAVTTFGGGSAAGRAFRGSVVYTEDAPGWT